MENLTPKIIGEGAYGCVIKPGIDSQGNPDTVPGYISKIEIEKSTIFNEINVSNKILWIDVDNFTNQIMFKIHRNN